MENKEKYNFGEKEYENINGIKLPVEFHTPKYKEAKNKAIELLESDKYKTLQSSDFWILINTYSNKTKVMYSGLIISHDGCLKINDELEDKLKFKPECMSLDKDGYNNSLVFSYICPEQGLYEVGEVSKSNCKNDYPYAMALKRCFDRVVLKNSRIAYSGIYSEVESDEFKEKSDDVVQKEEIKATPEQIKVLNAMYNETNMKKLLDKYDLKQIEEISFEKAKELIDKNIKTLQKNETSPEEIELKDKAVGIKED